MYSISSSRSSLCIAIVSMNKYEIYFYIPNFLDCDLCLG